jgi:hypothetical protein
MNIKNYRVIGNSKPVWVRKVFQHKIEDHIAGLHIIMSVHGYLAEEIPYLAVVDDNGSESVPQVIKCKQALAAHGRALVFRPHE